MICMISRLLCYLYLLLVPPKKPNFTYLLLTIVLTLSCLLFLVSFKIPNQAHLIYSIALLGVGLARGGAPLPYILVYKNLNNLDDLMA